MLNRIDLRARDELSKPDGRRSGEAELRRLLPRAKTDVSAAMEQVRPVVEAVHARGAEAVREATVRFDGVHLTRLRVPDEALSTALRDLEPAVRAGLEIAKIEPKAIIPPSAGEFYAKIPMGVQLDGNFHEIATFLDSIGRMQRIVNVSDIVLDNPKDVGGRLVITAKFTATTFMFVETAGAATTKGKAKPKGAK